MFPHLTDEKSTSQDFILTFQSPRRTFLAKKNKIRFCVIYKLVIPMMSHDHPGIIRMAWDLGAKIFLSIYCFDLKWVIEKDSFRHYMIFHDLV